MTDKNILVIQATSFCGSFIEQVTPLVHLIFMFISIVTGVILIYKFLKKYKDEQ